MRCLQQSLHRPTNIAILICHSARSVWHRNETRGPEIMELVLTEADLKLMPTELREQLLQYLAELVSASEPITEKNLSLTRDQAAALLREISFHRSGADLHRVLAQLTRTGRTRFLSRKRMSEALRIDGKLIGQYVTVLNQIAAKIAGSRDVRLFKYYKTRDSYAIEPSTRQLLRDVLKTMKASGKLEEPLWE